MVVRYPFLLRREILTIFEKEMKIKNTKSLTSVILAVSRSNEKENRMDSQSRSFVSHKCFWLLATVVVASCLGATPFASAAVAPDADRTYVHPSEDGGGSGADKNLTLTADTYTFRTDANPNGYHIVDWYTTYSGGSPVRSQHLYFYEDTDFSFATSGNYWVRAEIYGSNIIGSKGAWEASYRWYVTVQPPGSVRVYIEPSGARGAGAKWKLTNGPDTGWKSSGTTITNVPAGNYTVQFSSISGWDKPSDRSISVSPGSLTTTTGTYSQHTGSVRGYIEPSGARTAGANWRLTSGPDAGWKSSGTTISNVPVGNYTMTFSSISGWNKPSDKSVSVSKGSLTTKTGTYTATTGNLNVTVKNQNGSNIAGAIVVRYTSSWEYIDEKTTNPSSIASWPGINPGEYKLEAYYNGEYWVNDSATVIAGSTTNKTIQRNEPYAYDFRVYDGGTDVTNGTVMVGKQLRYEVQVRNSSPVSRTVRVKLWVDRNQASPYDFSQTSSSQSVSSGGGTKTFTFYHTPTATGTYYRSLEVQTYVNNNYTKTDSWPWGNVFDCIPPEITVISPNGGESWDFGNSYDITWNSTCLPGSNVRIELWKDDSKWDNIILSTSDDGLYNWEIPASVPTGTTYQVKIVDTSDSSCFDYSNGYFYITSVPTDKAEIVTFSPPPTGFLQRGGQTQATVRVKNTGNTTRSFWVGLSFAHESASNAGWPYGWYDIYPIQTDSLQPNEEQLVTFEFTIPETLQAGQYYAAAAIWEGFDVSRHQMDGERFDDTRNYPAWSDVETGETSFSLQPFALSQDNQTIVDQLKYILGLSQFIGTLEDSYRMGDDAEKPLLAIGIPITPPGTNIAGVPISVGGSVLIDLADLCEVTPEGKDGWVTVWVAGEEGMTIGGSLLPMGVVRHGFSFRERGFADYRSSILAAGEVTIPGFVFTAAYYDEYDGWHGPRLEWNGQLAISFSVLNGKFGSLVSREINRQIILDALIDAATPGIDLDSYVIDLIDLLAAIPSSGHRDITYDDGDWETNPSQWEANLKMRKLWDNPFDFSNYFYVDVPENTSELSIVTMGGMGNANLHIRYGQRPDGLYHEGEYTYGSNNPGNEETITISNPPSGKFYLMLAAVTEYDGVNLVANLTPATPILGDITGDGKVNYEDLEILANQWLQPPGTPSADIAPLPNGDGIVNFLDFAILAQHWLEGSAS